MKKRGMNFIGIVCILLGIILPGWVLAATQGRIASKPAVPSAGQSASTAVRVGAKDGDGVFVPVLTYHRVIPKVSSPFDYTPVQLEEQFRYIKSHGYHPITAAQMMSFCANPKLFPARPVVLSFDDGNPSHYKTVWPLLKKYGFTATFFVYPNLIMQKSQYLLTWSKLAEMAQAGEDIESHTMSHPYLTHRQGFKDQSAYLRWLDYELADSRQTIEKSLHQKVFLLAYPYGWFNSVVENEAKKAGYQGIFTVNWGNNDPQVNPLRIKRRVMSNSMTLEDLDRYLTARPLKLEIITPADTAVVERTPDIQFRIDTPGISKADVIIRTSRYTVTPDSRGIYHIPKPAEMKPGYYMVIIKAFDAQNHHYLDSWGFDYEPAS